MFDTNCVRTIITNIYFVINLDIRMFEFGVKSFIGQG